MSESKVFIWVLDIPKHPASEKMLFSATGADREEAESKIEAYIKSIPSLPVKLTPELFRQWVERADPLTAEVREGVWVLHLAPSIGSS